MSCFYANNRTHIIHEGDTFPYVDNDTHADLYGKMNKWN